MVKITTTILVDGKPVKEEHELVTNPCGLNMIVHQQNIKVNVPEFVEVNPQDTIRVMEEMSEAQWKWISWSGIFKQLWKSSFGDHIGRTYENDNEVPEIPEHVFILNMGDYGLRHIAGMIVLGCEACQQGRSVFFRNPETYLHPKIERTITYMLRDMLSLFNRSGQVQVAQADGSVEDIEVINELPDKDDDEIEVVEIIQQGKDPDAPNDVAQCIEWLELLQEHYSPEKAIAELKGERLTVAQMLDHVARNTQIGQWFVEQYVKMRDG